MTRIIGLTILFIFTLVYANVYADIQNEDKPLKGEWDFKPVQIWETESAGDEVLAQVAVIQVDKDGKIYVLEAKHRKFFVYSPEGEFLYYFGKTGEGPGEYKNIFNFFLKGNSVIVPDIGKIHYFAKDGTFVKSVIPGFNLFPKTFIDENRLIYVQDREDEKKKSEKVEIYDVNSKQHNTLVEVIAEKSLKASSENGGRQMTMVIKIGSITPVVVLTEHNNVIYYGKNDTYLINKIGLNGKKLLSFSLNGREYKKINHQYKKKQIEQISLNGRGMPADMAAQIIKGMPDTAPFFSRIAIEENGLIYVYLNDPVNETGQEIDIFSPEGKYLYHATFLLPDGLRKSGNMNIVGDYVYIFVEDSDGIGKLVKYKITKPVV